MEEPLNFNMRIKDSDVVASSDDKQMDDNIAQSWLDTAVSVYDPENRVMSTTLDYATSSGTLTQDVIAQTGLNAQSDLSKILRANGYIRQYINTNDVVGMVVSAVQSNINTDFRLSYKSFGTQKKKLNQLAKAKELIDDFNRQIDVQAAIRSAILITYTEGNYLCAIRQSDTNWVLDQYPLGIAEIAQYTESSRPIVQINMEALKSGLQRTILKNKKGKALYFEDVKTEIEGAFGTEIKDAYVAKDSYCRLPTAYTGVTRINNLGKQYGLSPIYRSLSNALILETLRDADIALAKAKQKSIIHQVMRKEDNGAQGQQARNFERLTWNHSNLLKAFKRSTVLVTTDPSVERIEYIAPKAEEISVSKQDSYMRKILSSLGVAFLVPDQSQSATTAKISWQVLLQQINAISEQVERMFENFYRSVLVANNIDPIYCPTMRILDAEMLDAAQRLDLAKLLYSTLACSRQTAYGIVGFDIEDEKARREQENIDNLDETFRPYLTSYTSSGDEGDSGRPAGTNPEDPDKQLEDKNNRN